MQLASDAAPKPPPLDCVFEAASALPSSTAFFRRPPQFPQFPIPTDFDGFDIAASRKGGGGVSTMDSTVIWPRRSLFPGSSRTEFTNKLWTECPSAHHPVRRWKNECKGFIDCGSSQPWMIRAGRGGLQ